MNVASTLALILVVDDSFSDRDMLSRRLRRAGCTVVTADSGEEALRVIERHDIDMVLLDVTMPGMDGLAVLEQVRRRRSVTELPIIILTARDDRSDVIQGFQLGANDYLTKPVDFPVVLSRVQTQLMLKRLTVEVDATRSRMNRELQAAARVHRSLLPQAPHAIGSVKFSWTFYACEELAGDVMDIIQLDDDHVGCYLLDVNGRGVEAALFAFTLNRALSQVTTDSFLIKRTSSGRIEIVPPATVARALNRRFPMLPETPQYFALLYGVLNIHRYEFRYVVAGHPGVLYVPYEGEAAVLPSSGCAIGWFKDTGYEERTIQLGPGDRLYMYSDGVTSALNPAGDCFGDHLITSIQEGRDQSLDNSLSWLIRDVKRWCGQTAPQDDVSVIAIEISR